MSDPSEIFYDEGISHPERLERLRAALREAEAVMPEDENEAGAEEFSRTESLRRYVGDTFGMLLSGYENWGVRSPPHTFRDRCFEDAAAEAAAGVKANPPTNSFLERLLEEAVLDAWKLVTRDDRGRARARLDIPGWDPQPGPADIALFMSCDEQPSVIAELKVLDVEHSLWDLLKVLSILEHSAVGARGYLLVASTRRRWERAEVAELFPTHRRVVQWQTREVLDRWSRSWATLLRGGRGRPRDLPACFTTRVLGQYTVSAFDEYELRLIVLEPQDPDERVVFGDDGWPVAAKIDAPGAPRERRWTLRDLAEARVQAIRLKDAAPSLRDYHLRRSEALENALHLNLSDCEDRALLRLSLSMQARLASLSSPFDGMLEAPASVAALHAKHADVIRQATQRLRERLLDAFAEATAGAFGLSTACSVSAEELAAWGWDPATEIEPDPDDFL